MDYNLKSSIWDRNYNADTNNKRSGADRIESQIARIERMVGIGERRYSIHHDNTLTTIKISDDFDVRKSIKKPASIQDQDAYRVTIRLTTRPNTAHPAFLTNLLGHQDFTKIR